MTPHGYFGAFALLCLATLAAAEQRTVSGIVVDSSGKPIAGARVDHTGATVGRQTDANGRFALETLAPAVVIRKVGFQSAFLRTEAARDVRIVLDAARLPAACTLKAIPKATTKTSRGVDYTSTTYMVEVSSGLASMVCGRGPMWSVGIPDDRLVWESVEYSETMPADRMGLVDAHGKTEDGKYWRYRGMLGDSCAYSRVDQAAAAAFDCLLEMPGAK